MPIGVGGFNRPGGFSMGIRNPENGPAGIFDGPNRRFGAPDSSSKKNLPVFSLFRIFLKTSDLSGAFSSFPASPRPGNLEGSGKIELEIVVMAETIQIPSFDPCWFDAPQETSTHFFPTFVRVSM